MTTDDDCNPPTCPHGMTIVRYDVSSWQDAEEDERVNGVPNLHPLPPFCRCCGQPCMLGTSFCNVCTTVIPA